MSTNGNVYKISLLDGELISEEYKERGIIEAPDCYYVYDNLTALSYKIYMEGDQLCSELYNKDIEVVYASKYYYRSG
mgnify:CR=1 FL=1